VTNHGDDLQRLLSFILTEGQGSEFKRWMTEAQFSNQYAPLYHAFVAALEGEDHPASDQSRDPATGIGNIRGIMHRFKPKGI